MKNGEYILVLAPEWYKGKRYRKRYCYEHHLVWKEYTDLSVPEGCIIHHKDGNKHNNNINNLQLMSGTEHRKLHSTTGKNIVKFICPVCKKIIEREKRLCKNKICFCSLRCSGLFNFYRKSKEEKEKVKNEQFIGM